VENIEIARTLDEVADLLEIQDANPFRVRAYRTAARSVGALDRPVAELLADNPDALEELPGIGADLAGKIAGLAKSGRLPLLGQLTRKTPESLVAMLRLPGLGPKRARLIYETLGVRTLAQLERAARAGRLSTLPGIGARLEQAILRGIQQDQARGGRFPLAEAEAYVQPLVKALRDSPGVGQLDIAGSMRRRSETVGDVDILVAVARGSKAADRFVRFGDVKEVIAEGPTRCAVRLRSGLQVDLRLVPAASYGAALHYFTGSKAHNIEIRRRGVRRKLKINEYGVFRGTRKIGGRTEAEIFRAVGLPFIPPELRENRGEIEAAERGALPHLVELSDIRGDLQMHTVYSDGRQALPDMVRACAERGYEYIAITDHTQAVRVAGGIGRAGFRKQAREIELVQKRHATPVILKSAEVDILEDGTLDLDEATLSELDLVVVSVHSKFNLTRAQMTRRIVRALKHPRVHVLGHPTGRLLGRREPYAVDMGEVIKAARDHGVLLEVNAQPERLDLNDQHAAMARQAGVKLVISTDAHRTDELRWMTYGVDQARRGWCTAADIANTRDLAGFRALLRK
jgi:DNA polymerase (family 10)